MLKKKKSNPHDPPPGRSRSKIVTPSPTSLDAIDKKNQSLNLKYSKPSFLSSQNPNIAAKLYLHIGGSSPTARWITSEKLTSFSFARSSNELDDDATGPWFLIVGSKIQALVGPTMQLKPFPDQRRVDFVADGVWALKFFTPDGYRKFCDEYQNCLFKNSYDLEAMEENRAKVFGKDFLGWARPEEADDSVWEDAEESFEKSSRSTSRTPSRMNQDLLEEFEEAACEGGIQSLALGALENSFLVSNLGIQVVKNFSHGIHGKGVSVRFSGKGNRTGFSTPKKALLMRAETNMLLMSPTNRESHHSTGVHQLDIETGKVD